MLVSERVLKWALRAYPPLLLQRVWVKKIDKGFCGASVKIFRSILNINYNRSIFGGTIFSGADPVYPVLLYQLLRRKGLNCIIWVKKSEVNFLKPGNSNLTFDVAIPEEDLDRLIKELLDLGKVVQPFEIEMFDREQRLCVTIRVEIYIRHLVAA
ncbi:DUF4442 domain-containing protein [Pedobacter sp. SYSU D00535]|uniref:DUF4442 domain-containing protein n=1 Tax=Pedobacter sp. SYSU D00535 TaxID=2810308 RepID=UPI001A95AD2B|nr:DUF4442 domain-containing protein [Pedobacter sp. SYSU D00535]